MNGIEEDWLIRCSLSASATHFLEYASEIFPGWSLFEEINVENGVRQGFYMPPVLLHLHTCLIMECWHMRVQGITGFHLCLVSVLYSAPSILK